MSVATNSQRQQTFEQKRLKGRLLLITLALVFAVPAILAKLFLSQQWYQAGVTNHGTWFESRLMVADIGLDVNQFQANEPIWLLGYVTPPSCNQTCIDELSLLTQSHLALGKYQQRVQLISIVPQASSSEVTGNHFPKASADFQQLSQFIETNQVVIIDPLGEVIMKYDLRNESGEADSKAAKGLLSDLRKLLKLSRVG